MMSGPIHPAPFARRLPAATGSGTLPLLLLVLALAGCADPAPDPAVAAIEASIEAHGGEAFERGIVEFDFRGDRFLLARHDGRFRQERLSVDEEGRRVREQVTNDGTRVLVDGVEVELDAEARAAAELRVNSVLYFAFLPHRLRDPAVQARHLGESRPGDEPHDLVEVTFRPDDGGEDWEDRFLHWFHSEAHTLDWMAYRYERDGGGTRFRRAVNRREVGPLVVQDWENWDGGPQVERLEDYPELHAAGWLELVSMVEIENVTWAPGTPEDTAPDAPEPDFSSALAGLQLDVGLETARWTAGEEVRIRIALSNRGYRDRTLSFPTSLRHDLVLRDEAGDEVARWSDDMAFLQVMGEETVHAGEEGPVWTATWTVPDAPDTRHLEVVIPAAEGTLRASLAVEVESP